MTSFMDFMIAVPEFPVQESDGPIPPLHFLFSFSLCWEHESEAACRVPPGGPRVLRSAPD